MVEGVIGTVLLWRWVRTWRQDRIEGEEISDVWIWKDCERIGFVYWFRTVLQFLSNRYARDCERTPDSMVVSIPRFLRSEDRKVSTMNATRLSFCAGILPALALYGLAICHSQPNPKEDILLAPNASGVLRTFTASGTIDTTIPFFQRLGSNGRSCVTCHQPADGWTITPEHVKRRFEATGGLDPIFQPVDGSNSPRADVSTVTARRRAYSMLLHRSVIRVGLGIPADAEFRLAAVDDDFQAKPLDVRAGIAGAGGRLAQLRNLFAEQAEECE